MVDILSAETELSALNSSFLLKCGLLTISCRPRGKISFIPAPAQPISEKCKPASPGEDAPLANVHFQSEVRRASKEAEDS